MSMESKAVQKTIIDTFLQLLEEVPLRKITVNLLAERCGINRNTFYYHYRSVPDLLEQIITEETDRVIEAHPGVSTLEECFSCIYEYASSNRKVLLKVFRSARRDILEIHLWRICSHAVSSWFEIALKGRTLKKEDEELILGYYQNLLFGTLMRWLADGMDSGIMEQTRRLCQLKKGMLEELLERSLIEE